MKGFLPKEIPAATVFLIWSAILLAGLIACALILPPGSARVWGGTSETYVEPEQRRGSRGYKVYYGVSKQRLSWLYRRG